MLATCICLNGSLLDQLSCTIVYLHKLFTCTFGRINMYVCLSNVKVSEQCRIAASKGNQVLGMIRRNITYK